MTTTTQQYRDRGDSFDAIIASHRTEPVTSRARPTDEARARRLDNRIPLGVSLRAASIAVLAVGVAALAIAALVTVPQQSAGAASATGTGTGTGTGEVTAATIAAQVELGWSATGGEGSVTCPDPLSQEPGTSVECTAVYDSRALVFTAVIGDPALGEPRVVIAHWSEVVAG